MWINSIWTCPPVTTMAFWVEVPTSQWSSASANPRPSACSPRFWRHLQIRKKFLKVRKWNAENWGNLSKHDEVSRKHQDFNALQTPFLLNGHWRSITPKRISGRGGRLPCLCPTCPEPGESGRGVQGVGTLYMKYKSTCICHDLFLQ